MRLRGNFTNLDWPTRKRIIYYYERTLTTQVNDVEHIESQSLPNYGVVKIFFQPNVNINAALAQTTAASQTVLKYLPAGITPPTC